MKRQDKSKVARWMTVFPFYLFACLPLPAQTDSLLLRDYQFVKQQDLWLTSPNGAALTRLATSNIAEATLAVSRGRGGLVDFYQSGNTLEANASVEAFQRISTRTVVFGGISYDNLSGRHMTGSAFMHLPSATHDPWATGSRLSPFASRYPFDIVEDSLTNAGQKHRDVYRLQGGFGVDVYHGLALGARLDYTAANYAKYKDLRHKNKLMDLTLSIGAYVPVARWLNVGAGYMYHRNTESVDFGTYGKSDKVYKSLIDYGTFWGMAEQFGNEGYTDKSREMPLFEDNHGLTLQAEVCPAEGLTVYADLTTSRGDGYYGRQSPYTITYTQHDRHQTAASLSASYRTGMASHRLTFAYQGEKLANKAATHRELTNESGATYYEYYDPVETGDKQWDDFRLAYTADWGIRGELPTWHLQASLNHSERRQAVYLFPYYRHQHLKVQQVSASATRHLVRQHGVWSCTLGAAFRKGSGKPAEDYTFVTPSEGQDAPATMDAFLWREYQYLTAAQYRLEGSVRYAFVLPATRVKTHVQLSLSHRKANETYDYNRGKDHTDVSLAIGCTF